MNFEYMKAHSARWQLAALVLLVSMTAVHAREPAGVVIIAAGDVVAVSQDNQSRSLQRKTPFYVGDVLRVAETGQAQVRFRDGTILSLTGGTELRVDEFQFGPSAAEDSNVVTLLKGGFRTITGAIAKRNPQAQRIVTPVATIGVRGTHYSVVLQDAMFVGVWSGVVVVNNEAGDLELGANRAFSYAQIDDAKEAPKGLLEPPAALMETAAPTTTAETAQDSDAAKEESGEAAEANANIDTVREETAAAANDAKAEETDQQVDSWESLDEEGETRSVAGNDKRSTIESATVELAGEDATDTHPVDALSDFTIDNTIGKIAERLEETRYSGAEAALLNYYGMAVAGGTSSTFFAGQASNGEVAAPLIVDNGLFPVDELYASRVANHVLRQENATLSYYAAYDTHDASIGEWRGDSTAPFIDQTDVKDASVRTDFATFLFWAITGPPALDTLLAMTGSVLYRNVVDVRAGASGANPTEIFTRTAVDFSTAQVNGKLYVHTNNGDDWDMTFDGVLRGAALDLQVDATTSSVKRSDGSILGATGIVKAGLSGTGAQAIGGVFDFQTTGSTFVDVDGAFLLDNTAVGDLRLTSAEVSAVDRMGWAVVPVAPQGFLLAGTATSGSGAAPVLINSVLDTKTGYPMDVARIGLASASGVGSMTVDTSVIRWGMWNATVGAPGVLQVNADDPLQQQPIIGDVAWMTAITTPASVLATHRTTSKTGVWNGTVAGVFGADHTGASVSTVNFNANINFATGAITGASLNAQAGAGSWNANFSDTPLTGDTLRLTVNPASSVVTGLSGGTQSVAGQMAGGFVGNNAQGIAGVFHLHTEANPLVNINGGVVSTGTISP